MSRILAPSSDTTIQFVDETLNWSFAVLMSLSRLRGTHRMTPLLPLSLRSLDSDVNTVHLTRGPSSVMPIYIGNPGYSLEGNE